MIDLPRGHLVGCLEGSDGNLRDGFFGRLTQPLGESVFGVGVPKSLNIVEDEPSCKRRVGDREKRRRK